VHSPALAAYVGVLNADDHHFGVIAVAAVAKRMIEELPLEPDERCSWLGSNRSLLVGAA